MRYLKLINGFMSVSVPHKLFVNHCVEEWIRYGEKMKGKFAIRVAIYDGSEDGNREWLDGVWNTKEEADLALEKIINNLRTTC